MTSDELQLALMRTRRQTMIDDLIQRKKFSPKGARNCVDNFLETLQFVLDETGKLPEKA